MKSKELYVDISEKKKLRLIKVLESYEEKYEGYDTTFYRSKEFVVVEGRVGVRERDLFSSFFEGSDDQDYERTHFVKVSNLPSEKKTSLIEGVFE